MNRCIEAIKVQMKSIKIINFELKKNNFNIGYAIKIPSDKSISHRCVIFASLTKGESYLYNLLKSEDIKNTIKAFQVLGVKFDTTNNVTKITSPGYLSFNEWQNDDILNIDLGNSGTSCRLLMGVFSGIVRNFIFYGDKSLSKRPMKRVTTPLKLMGAKIKSNSKHIFEELYLPISIEGCKDLQSIDYTLEIPSAQVKSAILLASLWTEGETTIKEIVKTRDHTENIMSFLGLPIESRGNTIISNAKINQIRPFEYRIPKDFSSAAFFIVFTLLAKLNKVIFKDININPLRTGLIDVLKLMGANIDFDNLYSYGGEKVADIIIYKSELHGINVPTKFVSSMIDEFPVLFILSCLIEGSTTFSNLQELKYKESNRLDNMLENLSKIGVLFTKKQDGCTIHGGIKKSSNKKNIFINSQKDHRVAMSFVIMSAFCKDYNFVIDDINCISTSYPEFITNCKEIGLDFELL